MQHIFPNLRPVDMLSNRPGVHFFDKDNFKPNIDISIGDDNDFNVLTVLDSKDVLAGDVATEQDFSGVDF